MKVINQIEVLPAEVTLIVQETLGSRIRAARQKLHMSQSTLAHRCGLHESHVSKIERGKANPTVASLVAIALALQTNPFEPLKSISLDHSQDALPQAETETSADNPKPLTHRQEVHHGA